MFHEYMADQLGTVERICAANGLDITPEARTRFAAYLADNARHKHGRVHYDLAGQFGVDIGALRERFAFYYDAFPVAREPVEGERA